MSEDKSEDRIGVVNEQLDRERDELDTLRDRLAEIEAELRVSYDEAHSYQLLDAATRAVRALHAEGLDTWFWGESSTSTGDREAQLTAADERVAEFERNVAEREARRDALLNDIGEQQDNLAHLSETLFDLHQEEEDRANEWIVERDAGELSKDPQVMPWMRGFDDDQRYRRAVAASILMSVILGLLVPLIELPIPERDEQIEVPARFARLVKQPPKPPPPPRAVTPEPQPPEPEPERKPPEVEPEPQPQPVETHVAEVATPAVSEPTAKERVASRGILAFRDSLSSMADRAPSTRIGDAARLTDAGQAANGRPQRNMITSHASTSSGGINIAAISRDVGGPGGGAMDGVEATQVASAIAVAGGGGDRPLSAGAVAGRTDEEIQIVFDRYKAALYRLYNRRLRQDPTLRGQLVLQLTIEPDGSVSHCQLQASDMNAPVLAGQVVERVRAFDFGAKDVPVVTIVYPIDFLPTA